MNRRRRVGRRVCRIKCSVTSRYVDTVVKWVRTYDQKRNLSVSFRFFCFSFRLFHITCSPYSLSPPIARPACLGFGILFCPNRWAVKEKQKYWMSGAVVVREKGDDNKIKT